MMHLMNANDSSSVAGRAAGAGPLTRTGCAAGQLQRVDSARYSCSLARSRSFQSGAVSLPPPPTLVHDFLPSVFVLEQEPGAGTLSARSAVAGLSAASTSGRTSRNPGKG